MKRLVFLLPLACKVEDHPQVRTGFADKFERSAVGEAYLATGQGYAVAQGALSARGAKNHPLWLKQPIARDVRIEFDAWSTDPRGDIKVELFGDGRSFDPDGGAYRASGYVIIFGGWNNSRSMIVRQDEHGDDTADRSDKKVIPNQRYRWRLERKGKLLRWYLDDMSLPFLALHDPDPLAGPGHAYFGFNNWQTDTWFDNLVITPL